MPAQETVRWKGGTMRLGAYPCRLKQDSLALPPLWRDDDQRASSAPLRGEQRVPEDPRPATGMVFCGTSPDDVLVEMIELPDHPFFIASQFHPEFRSRPNRAHPLFAGLVAAAIAQSRARPASAHGSRSRLSRHRATRDAERWHGVPS